MATQAHAVNGAGGLLAKIPGGVLNMALGAPLSVAQQGGTLRTYLPLSW